MGTLNIPRTRDLLQRFDFDTLFIEELGWSKPANRKAETNNFSGVDVSYRQVANLAGVVVLEITSSDGKIPDSKSRKSLHQEISKLFHENLIIFTDKERTQSIWFWAKREDRKIYPREHPYFKGQPGDLFISKLSSIVFEIGDFDKSGDVSVVEVARRLKNALDVERVTKKFYGEFHSQHIAFLELIEGISDDQQRRWYASVLLNRLMFIYFLQKKGFIDGGDQNYLQSKLTQSTTKGKNCFYRDFLKILFFEGFAKPEGQRSKQAQQILGKIKYLNGGLFLPHPVELSNPKISVPDKAFENLLGLFHRYSWNLNDTPGGEDNEINPDVLGYIFEKYINQKAFGAYYTRPEITEYLCERTIQNLVLDKVNSPGIPGVLAERHFDSIADLLLNLDALLCKLLLNDVLPSLSILDPACGSGAFLVAAMKTLINIYSALIGKTKFLSDQKLTKWLKEIEKVHPSVNYFIKKRIITDNLFGVDIMEEAVEIAKLRLFLALVAAANNVDDLEPLPNIDFNVQFGNSLIGLMRVDDTEFEKRHPAELFRKSYRQVLQERNRLLDTYRHTATYTDNLRSLRDQIEAKKKESVETLNSILLDEFSKLGIKYEQAVWDEKKKADGRPVRRALKQSDIEALKPFHWGFEFDEIINKRGGFDAIITNPPWEIFKPNSKEFFEEFSDLVTKKKMTIHDFEKEQSELLRDPEIRKAWLDYLSSYPHLSAFFRAAPQFKNQISVVDGKKSGTDINLYKLFTEQCFNLLRTDGYCGIVIPSGIYTDLGTKQLREMLFTQSKVTGLFCFENRKQIFEGVDSRFKFNVLTFEKGGVTKTFPAAFMRHEVAELECFPQEGATLISINLIRRLSPDSLSVIEFKNEADVCVFNKMNVFPRLGERLPGKWNLVLGNEFHMTGDSHLFKTEPAKGRLPLYEGKMISQFNHEWAKPRYWIDEIKGRKVILGRGEDKNQNLAYQSYRLGHRSIASSTNERTMIATVLPPKVFFGHSINASREYLDPKSLLFLTGILNSFIFDFALRASTTTNLTMFFIYQLSVPRLTGKDALFAVIVQRAARLICTTAEFDDLAKEVGLKSHKDGVADPDERAKLRAELDGLVAHLYGLTEEEFSYILTTFPIVPQPVKDAALEAYHIVRRGLEWWRS